MPISAWAVATCAPPSAPCSGCIRSPAAPAGVDVHVGGANATAVDEADYMGPRFPWFIALVLALNAAAYGIKEAAQRRFG